MTRCGARRRIPSRSRRQFVRFRPRRRHRAPTASRAREGRGVLSTHAESVWFCPFEACMARPSTERSGSPFFAWAPRDSADAAAPGAWSARRSMLKTRSILPTWLLPTSIVPAPASAGTSVRAEGSARAAWSARRSNQSNGSCGSTWAPRSSTPNALAATASSQRTSTEDSGSPTFTWVSGGAGVERSSGSSEPSGPARHCARSSLAPFTDASISILVRSASSYSWGEAAVSAGPSSFHP